MISYSIVISTYNQKETVRKALDSIESQIKNPKAFEIIVADDGSNDGTNEFIKRQRYPIFLKYLQSPTNRGRAPNRNRGFQKAVGEWVIFIDGDMIPAAGFIDAYMKAWNEFPNGVLLGSWEFPPKHEKSRWDDYFVTRGHLVLKDGDKVPGRFFTSGNFAIRRTLLERLGGFDMSFEGWGGEDTEFGLRLEKDGIPIYNIPGARCFHFHSKSLGDIIAEYENFGRYGYPLLVKRFPQDVIYEQGWLLGLPGPGRNHGQAILSSVLYPLRSNPFLAFLRGLAGVRRGKLMNDALLDMLFYGHMAKGFRKRAK